VPSTPLCPLSYSAMMSNAVLLRARIKIGVEI
jgi:hypothetical protein